MHMLLLALVGMRAVSVAEENRGIAGVNESSALADSAQASVLPADDSVNEKGELPVSDVDAMLQEKDAHIDQNSLENQNPLVKQGTTFEQDVVKDDAINPVLNESPDENVSELTEGDTSELKAPLVEHKSDLDDEENPVTMAEDKSKVHFMLNDGTPNKYFKEMQIKLAEELRKVASIDPPAAETEFLNCKANDVSLNENPRIIREGSFSSMPLSSMLVQKVNAQNQGNMNSTDEVSSKEHFNKIASSPSQGNMNTRDEISSKEHFTNKTAQDKSVEMRSDNPSSKIPFLNPVIEPNDDSTKASVNDKIGLFQNIINLNAGKDLQSRKNTNKEIKHKRATSPNSVRYLLKSRNDYEQYVKERQNKISFAASDFNPFKKRPVTNYKRKFSTTSTESPTSSDDPSLTFSGESSNERTNTKGASDAGYTTSNSADSSDKYKRPSNGFYNSDTRSMQDYKKGFKNGYMGGKSYSDGDVKYSDSSNDKSSYSNNGKTSYGSNDNSYRPRRKQQIFPFSAKHFINLCYGKEKPERQRDVVDFDVQLFCELLAE
ncbi:hypothetical protein ENBRE01_2624 [Enteropsectra breve]|nr:hypothetical protein ENBRE01_2624 [Enteropsectra breve]